MISKAKIRQNVIAYLDARRRRYRDLAAVEDIYLSRQEPIAWGPSRGRTDDVFTVSYFQGDGPMAEMIFVQASAHTGQVYFSRGPMNYLEELEAPEDLIVKEERDFVEQIFETIFKLGDFTLYDGTRHALIYESEEYSLEFQYDLQARRMNYAGLYIRVMETENAYRLRDLVEFFDSQGRRWDDIVKPYKDFNEIALRIHAGLIETHLMATLIKPDISWEPDFRAFLKAKGAPHH